MDYDARKLKHSVDDYKKCQVAMRHYDPHLIADIVEDVAEL